MNPLSLLLFALVVGDVPVVLDECKLFDQETIDKVTREVRQIKQANTTRKHTGLDLVIETTRERPAVMPVVLWKQKHRHETLDQFALDRAKEFRDRYEEQSKFSGIYVVIIESEGKSAHREVGVAAYPTGWGADDEVSDVKRDALRDVLMTKEAQADNNRGLSELLVRFRAQQESIIRPDAPALTTNAALLIAGVLVGVWMLVRFVRWRDLMNPGPNDSPSFDVYQPAMMGTLFGLPAAFWVNDELFRSLPPDVPPMTAGNPDSLSLPPMPDLPPPPTQAGPQPFTHPDPGSVGGGEPPPTTP